VSLGRVRRPRPPERGGPHASDRLRSRRDAIEALGSLGAGSGRDRTPAPHSALFNRNRSNRESIRQWNYGHRKPWFRGGVAKEVTAFLTAISLWLSPSALEIMRSCGVVLLRGIYNNWKLCRNELVSLEQWNYGIGETGRGCRSPPASGAVFYRAPGTRPGGCSDLPMGVPPAGGRQGCPTGSSRTGARAPAPAVLVTAHQTWSSPWFNR
jgi:hypothetical protein